MPSRRGTRCAHVRRGSCLNSRPAAEGRDCFVERRIKADLSRNFSKFVAWGRRFIQNRSGGSKRKRSEAGGDAVSGGDSGAVVHDLVDRLSGGTSDRGVPAVNWLGSACSRKLKPGGFRPDVRRNGSPYVVHSVPLVISTIRTLFQVQRLTLEADPATCWIDLIFRDCVGPFPL